MSVLIDTGPLAGVKLFRDKHHARSLELIEEAMHGKYGKIYVSDYIFDELATLLLVRSKRKDISVDYGESILTSRFIEMVHVDGGTFKRAWEIFRQYDNLALSFTDCTSIALMENLRIENIISFDLEFDAVALGIVRIS